MKKSAKAFAFDKRYLLKILIMSNFSLLLLFCSVFSAFACEINAQKVNLNIKMENAPLSKVISEIKSQTEFEFAYEEDLEKLILANVSVNVKSENIETILGNILEGTRVNYRVIDRIILLSKNNLQTTSETLENSLAPVTITGTVKDKIGPLPGVSIVIKGTTQGTVSDVNGRFSIDVPDAKAILVFSFVGFIAQEIPVQGLKTIDVVMKEEAVNLEEVVVIGYGTREKKDVTTSISSISSKNIEKVVGMSGESAMQGSMSGVQVAGVTGNPMNRPTIRIRGLNTWGVSNPLYVVDGIPITEFGAGIEGLEDGRAADVRGPINIMTMIDPNDIESISVLKDASAAAIYGVRAANGVILITTKKGRGDKPSVEFSTRMGVQNIKQKVDVLNTAQYAKHVQDVFASDPTITVEPENEHIFDPTDPLYLGNSPTYNWQDAVRVNDAQTQDYSFRIIGGTDKSDYYFSAGYGNTQGTVIGNNLEVYSTSFKLNTQVNKFVKVGINYRLATAKGSDAPYGFDYISEAQTAPWQPIYDVNGPAGYAPTVGGILPDGTYSSSRLYGTGTRISQPGIVALNSTTYKSMRNMGSAYIELSPLKGLKVTGRISIDSYDFTRYEFTDYASSVFNYTAGDPRSFGGGKSVGNYGERDVKNFNMINEFTINYAKSFGDHNFDILFNGSDQQYKHMYKGVSTEYMTTVNPDLRALGGENKYTNIGSIPWEKSALEGLMARGSYNYASKYYLDATIRRDGSSRFAEDNRWGIFPSFSAAWRISGESFMKDISWLNDLKFRGGWGQLGNQEVTPWAFLSPISTKPTYAWGIDPTAIGKGNFSSAASVYSMPNPALQWEKLSTINLGFDATMLESLTFSFEYYNKLNDGILQNVNLPGSVGLVEQPKANIASVRNTGIELSLNYSKTIGDLVINVGGNLTTVKNTVESTYHDIPMGNIEKGYSMYYIKGYKVGGIFQNQAEIDAWMAENSDVNYEDAKIKPGDMYFLDQRSAPTKPGTFYTDSLDNKIDDYDQVYLGKTLPGFFYGFNVDAQYKGFDFSAQFTGVGDVDKVNTVRQAMENTSSAGNNVSTAILNSWTPTNTATSMPRVIGADPAKNFRASDMYVESGAYLRLTNFQIGYTLPVAVYDFTKQYIKNHYHPTKS